MLFFYYLSFVIRVFTSIVYIYKIKANARGNYDNTEAVEMAWTRGKNG